MVFCKKNCCTICKAKFAVLNRPLCKMLVHVDFQSSIQECVRITGESYAFDHWEQRFQFDTVQCSERQSNRKRKEVWEENCSSVSTIAFSFKVLRKNEWRRKADEKCSGLWPAAPSILHACHLAAPTIVLYTPPSPPPPSLAFVRRLELHLLAVGSWVPNISPLLQLFSSDHRPIFFPPPPPWAFIRRLELRPIQFASGWILGFKHIVPSSESTLCWLIFEMCLLWSEIDYLWRVFEFLAAQKELISVLTTFPCMTDLNFFFCELTKCDNIGFHNTHYQTYPNCAREDQKGSTTVRKVVPPVNADLYGLYLTWAVSDLCCTAWNLGLYLTQAVYDLSYIELRLYLTSFNCM